MKWVAWMVVAVLAWGVADLQAGEKGAAKKNPNLGCVRHVVLFKFKEGTKAEDIKKVEDGFRALPSKIPTIIGYEWGTNVSPEGLSQGFTHCFLVTFKNVQDRDGYLPHPAHKAFVQVLGPHLDKAFVVDYVAKE